MLSEPGVRYWTGDFNEIVLSPEVARSIQRVIWVAPVSQETRDHSIEIKGLESFLRNLEPEILARFVYCSTLAVNFPHRFPGMEKAVAAHGIAEELIAGSKLPFTIVRPGELTFGQGDQPLVIGESITTGGYVNRRDLAGLLVRLSQWSWTKDQRLEVVQRPDGRRIGEWAIPRRLGT